MNLQWKCVYCDIFLADGTQNHHMKKIHNVPIPKVIEEFTVRVLG